MALPLLDRERNFEIYHMINIPISCASAEHGPWAVAEYEIEYIALNSTRTKVILLTREESRKYKADAFGTCASFGPIYVTGNQRCCLFDL